MATIEVKCLIHGERIGRAFSVEVDPVYDVHDLAEKCVDHRPGLKDLNLEFYNVYDCEYHPDTNLPIYSRGNLILEENGPSMGSLYANAGQDRIHVVICKDTHVRLLNPPFDLTDESHSKIRGSDSHQLLLG